MANRRGRPRQDRPKIDLGTPELIKHRITMAPKDATLSTTPLDALKSRGDGPRDDGISEEAYSAATYFASLRKLVFGKAHSPAIDLTAVSRGGPPEELDTAEAERKYRDACNYVKGQGHQAFVCLWSLVVDESWPHWMFTGSAKTSRAKHDFMVGLSALLAWYKGERRKAA